jgi:hypothetical protein
MNRLTERKEIVECYRGECPKLKQEIPTCDECQYIDKAISKLAAYEDTGLEPEEVKQLNTSDASKEESSIKYYNEMRKYRDELKYYKDLEKQLIDKYNELKNKIDGDGAENYTNGYKHGRRNGQIKLLERILNIDTGYREEAEKALNKEGNY